MLSLRTIPVSFERYISRLVVVKPVTHKYTHTFYLHTYMDQSVNRIHISIFTARRNAQKCKAQSCDRMSIRLSVRLSRLDNYHMLEILEWKLIAQTISPTPSLFVAQRPSTQSQGNMGKFWGD